jgi:hypothetical protein
MLLGRYQTESAGSSMPQEWHDSFINVLNSAYADVISKNDRFFDVYGRIYDEEFVVIVSYIHIEDQMASPISLFLSHDIIADEKQMKKALDNVMDLAGLIFDDILASDDWNDYNPNWTENKYKGNTFYYKVTRENISLTLQANEILEGNIDL